jgi:CO/xanthine dehydrogenase Mo-binding subunit
MPIRYSSQLIENQRTYVGRNILPVESEQLLKANSQYVDDLGIREGKPLFLSVVRSPYAHARIKKIDLSSVAEKCVLVITSNTIEQCFGRAEITADSNLRGNIVKMPVLAESKVKYVGEPIIGLIGQNRYEAEDLIDLVSIEYDVLRPVLSISEALSQNYPVIHDDRGLKDNISIETTIGSSDVDTVFREADVVVEDDLEVHRVAPNSIEPRGIYVNYADERFNIMASCQGVFYLKRLLCETTGLPDEKIRVIQPEVGGAFGAKSAAYPEYILALAASKILSKPVKWIESRSEHIVATQHGRDVRARLSLAASKDGKILGLKGRVIGDLGAYNFSVNANHAAFIAQQLAGPYSIGSARVEVKSVFTNKTPTGPYRGAGRPEATFFIERMIDLLSDELGVDGVELRRRNLVTLNDMPYQTPLGLTLDPEDYLTLFDQSIIQMDYAGTKKWVQTERIRRDRLIGLGFSNYVEINRSSVPESALVRIDSSGITAITGLGPHGQGHRTIISQLLADEFETSIEMIRVLYGDSDLMTKGVGTFGSRSSTIGCAALVAAAREVKDKALVEAGKIFGCKPNELQFSEFSIKKRNDSRAKVPISDLAYPNLEASAFMASKDVFSFGAHLVVVEIDRETGKVSVLYYKAVDDAGRILNPLIAEGQIYGGILMGLGQVLYESIDYNQDGQPVEGNIGDAGVPTVVEAPEIESTLLEYPSELIHHSRGIGEAGTIGSLAAVVRAVEDAIGVRVSTTRLSQERIKKLLSEKVDSTCSNMINGQSPQLG